MHRIHLLLLPALACATIAGAAVPGDPPSRVGRLSYLRGPVSYSPAGVDAWAQASLNRPVVSGDRVWTDPGARDELHVGNAAIRMDGGTLLNVLRLDDEVMQMQLAQGTLDIRVRSLPASGAIEVDTPNLAFSIMRPGHYRIDAEPSGEATMVRVADGQAQVIGRGRAYLVNPGQAFRFGGTDLAPVQLVDAGRRDDFDRWSASRDQRAERSRAARYVSPAMIGYEDLDDNGSWRDVDGYGPVWMPSHVSRDWAPYRDGHWAWIDPWGWTWVDDAPWGFATTHYGRWANVRGDWGWVPGPAAATPVYAPALVMFVAAGNLIQSRHQPGDGVAWFPLAPHEAYRPTYHASPRYLANINTSNTIVNQNVYVNRQVAGAVTAVPARVFARAQPVRPAAVALPSAIVANAQVTPAATVRAQRESLASRLTGGHRPTRAALARPVMARMAPASVAGVRPPGPQANAPGFRPPVAQASAAPAVAPSAPPAHNPHARNGGHPGWPAGAEPGHSGRFAAAPARIAPVAAMGAPTAMPAPVRTLPPHAMPLHPLPPHAMQANPARPAAAHMPAPIAMHGRPAGAAAQAAVPPSAWPRRPQPSLNAPVPMPAPVPPHQPPHRPLQAVHAQPVPMRRAAHALQPSPQAQHPLQVAQHAAPAGPMPPARHANAGPIAPPHPPAQPMRAGPPPQPQGPHPMAQHPTPAPAPQPHAEAPHPQARPENAHHEGPPPHPQPAPPHAEPKESHHDKH